MKLKELFQFVSNGTDIKIISAFNGKTRTTSHIKAKDFYEYELLTVRPKIKVNKSKWDYDNWATPYLEISISDYNDWRESEDNNG